MGTKGCLGLTRVTPEAFWAKGVRVGPCLEWPGVKDGSGYGRVRFGFRHGGQQPKWRVHRLAWTLARGPIPPGLQVCHTCDNPACYEPLHLFLGTNADNHRDAVVKGRQKLVGRAGEGNHESKLTEAAVREIRRLSAQGVSHPELARQFQVSKSAIWLAAHRRSWQGVE